MPKGKRKLKLKEAPDYPFDYQAKQYVRDAIKRDPVVYPLNKWYRKLSHSDTVDLTITAGKADHFFAFAYPGMGVTITEPEDIEGIQLLEAWCFEYLVKYDTLNTLVKLSRDGDMEWALARKRWKP